MSTTDTALVGFVRTMLSERPNLAEAPTNHHDAEAGWHCCPSSPVTSVAEPRASITASVRPTEASPRVTTAASCAVGTVSAATRARSFGAGPRMTPARTSAAPDGEETKSLPGDVSGTVGHTTWDCSRPLRIRVEPRVSSTDGAYSLAPSTSPARATGHSRRVQTRVLDGRVMRSPTPRPRAASQGGL